MTDDERPSRSVKTGARSTDSGSRTATEDPSRRARKRRRRRTKDQKPPAPPAPRVGARVAFALFVIFGALLAAAATYLLVVYPQRSTKGSGKLVALTFVSDDSVSHIADELAKAGVIPSARTFALYARFVGLQVAPGPHLLSDDATPDEIVHRLERRGATTKVTIPEGYTRFDIARRLQTAQVASSGAFLEATTDPDLLHELAMTSDSFEGFLFPATYDFAKDSDPRDVVRRMFGEFERRFSTLEQNHSFSMAALKEAFGWSRWDVVILASMVEREAAVDDERPIIASVFVNRLRDPSFKRRVLQCDPTAGYGCLVLGDRVPSCAGYTGKITHAINVDPLNTYSTYVHEGLPPGPIANPGMKSLLAAISPANTKYLYFVVREGKRHTFSETLDDHNAAVKDLRERTSREP